MKMVIAWLSVTVALAGPAYAQTAGPLPQFQVDPFWPKPLPNNWILGQVSGIATDKSDRIWVVHRPGSLTPRERAAEQNPPEAKCCIAAPPVLVFDQSGNLIRHWGGSGPGYEWPESEHGIFIDDNDFVWLAGNGKKDGQLLKFTMDGKFVLQIGKQGQGNDSNSTERLGSPADVAVDVAAKEVFAADGYANRRVVVFDSETGAYKRHWGAYGNKPSDEKTPPYDPARAPSQQFGNPVHCIRIDKDGLVYVCDRTNNRLQIFRKDGSFVAEQVYEKDDARHRLGLRSRILARQGAEIHLYDRRHERGGAHRRPLLEGDTRPLRSAWTAGGHVYRTPQHRGRPPRQHLHLRGEYRPAGTEVPANRHAELNAQGLVSEKISPWQWRRRSPKDYFEVFRPSGFRRGARESR